MSGANNQRGFTIVEVSLFLAVSALLLSTLVFGVQRMISQARFNDSIDHLTAHIQAQYEEVRSGVNARDFGGEVPGCTTAAPGTSNCLLLGKVMYFEANSSRVTTRYVIAKSGSGLANSDLEAIKNSEPTVIENAQEVVNIQWGATFKKGVIYGDYVDNFNALAIIHSPISSRVYVAPFYAGNVGASPLDYLNYIHPMMLVIESAEAWGARGAGICIERGDVSSTVHSVMPISPNITSEEATGACGR